MQCPPSHYACIRLDTIKSFACVRLKCVRMNAEQPRSTAQTSQACEEIRAGPQGKRPQSAQNKKSCNGNRPLSTHDGAGPRHSSRPATKRPQTGDMEQNRPKTWDGWQGWGGASRREWAETGMCEGLAQGAVPRERHDGVRSTTVTGLAAGRGRKREALAVKRPVLPPFPPTD